jgi:hypothetical protein
MISMDWKKAVRLAVGTDVFLLNVAACPARQTAVAEAPSAGETSLDVKEVVSGMELRNQERSSALRKFEGTRIYRMQYHGFFGTRDAEMVVAVKASPAGKEFSIESQSGSKFIVEHVLMKLLDGEQEATGEEARQRTALTSKNYNFTLAGLDRSSEVPEYVLNVIPRTDEKYLYRGKVWIDSKDFAVTRIEAEPAKSPSIWIKKTDIKHSYEKVGDFWLPAENKTESLIRFGGRALLSIEYRDYRITDAAPLNISTPVIDARSGAAGH